MSTLKVNTLQTAAGVEVYTCKAWVNFDGTGTVAIRGSGNVTDIDDNSNGDYTVNFTNAMTDANYAPVFSVGRSGQALTSDLTSANATTTTSVRLRSRTAGTNTGTDADIVAVAVFR